MKKQNQKRWRNRPLEEALIKKFGEIKHAYAITKKIRRLTAKV